MDSFLFLLNTYADIDHITPIIWHSSQKGIHCIIIFSRHYDWADDYRIKFLQKFDNVEICELRWMRSAGLAGKIYRKLRYGRSFVKKFLIGKNIKACVTEWYRPSNDLRGRLLAAARELGIPCFGVPHGCNVHLNYNTKHAQPIENMKKIGRWSDISDMNACSVFVVDSQHNRQMFLDGGIDEKRCQVWGSSRYCPEWVKKNTEICPFFLPKKDHSNKLKVVFFLPHWRNNVDKPSTMLLIERIARSHWAYLVVKEHTRGNGEFPADHRPKFENFSNVEIGESAHSASLIVWSDVVISFGSSIAIDAVVQGKPLIYPAYLHGNTTIYDKFGGCFKASSVEEVLDSLNSLRNGKARSVDSKEFLKNVIFGGNEPFDILEYHYSRIANLNSVK